MSDAFVSILFGAGIAGWAFSKLAKSSGNPNPGANAIAASIAGGVAAIVFFTILKFILHL